jgi:hypothetical protein
MSNIEDQILTRIAKRMQEEIDEQMITPRGYNLPIKIHDQSTVDGETWYTIGCYDDTSKWLRSQNRELWHEHVEHIWAGYHNTFDIHEKLYTMLALKWSS